VRQPRSFLTVHGVERDDAVGNPEFAEQLLCGRDFVGLFLNIDMGQNQAGFDVKCVQQLGCLAVVEVVEASPQRLPVQRDAAPRWIGCRIAQTSGVAAEHLFDSLWIKALEDIANSGMSGRTLPAQTEGTRPTMRFVEVKAVEQIDTQALHRARAQMLMHRTRLISQMRAFCLEYGVAIRQGAGVFKLDLPRILEDHSNDLSPAIRWLLAELLEDLHRLEGRIAEITREIEALVSRDEVARRLMTIPGIGPLGSSALLAAVGQGRQFKKARDLSACLGLVPRQYSNRRQADAARHQQTRQRLRAAAPDPRRQVMRDAS